jgi:DNA-binding MarR family transcriptional regulator
MKKTPADCAFYQAESYRPEDSVGYLMRQILNRVAQEVERQLAHTDLTNAQWIPLFKLYSGQASTVAELARGCNLDAGAMTRMLDRLEAKSLCKRVRSETDRRVIHIELTPAGTQAASDIPEILSGVQNAHLAGFSAEEFQTLRDYLRRILHNAQSIADLAHDLSCPSADSHNAL